VEKVVDYNRQFSNQILRYDRLYRLKAPKILLDYEWKQVKKLKRGIDKNAWLLLSQSTRAYYANHALIRWIFRRSRKYSERD